MQTDALLRQLGYAPNEALEAQMKRIVGNTKGFDRIEKHLVDLHNVLKVDEGYVAMSNTNDCFKIKFEEVSAERREEAMQKIQHFSDKYKVRLEKVDGKDTYYIIGYDK